MERSSADIGDPSTPDIQKPTLSFLSQLPKLGNPPLTWDDFKTPKLRRLPRPRDDIKLQGFLGRGEDGIVVKAQIKDKEEPVAVKIFHFNRQPPPVGGRSLPPPPHPLYPERARLFNNYRPQASLGAPRYWPLERECINCALLEKIETSLQNATMAGQQIYLNLRPRTRDDAIRNLWAFSSEGRADDSKPPEHFVPYAPDVQITPCHGWIEFQGSDINAHLVQTRAQCAADLEDNETYYAIVYAYVPDNKLGIDSIISQLGFFHIAGFNHVLFKPDNWMGAGVLVDFSDIISPFAGRWWRDSNYINPEHHRNHIKGIAERGGLRKRYGG